MKYVLGMLVILLSIGISSGFHEAWGEKPFDVRRYGNIWHGNADWNGAYGRAGLVNMIITISSADNSQAISWEINGKILEHVDYEYPNSKLQNWIPLFCISAQDEEYKHMFCGILYDEVSWDDRIRGVYELVSPCQIAGKSEQCGEVLAIDLQAEIDKYDGHR